MRHTTGISALTPMIVVRRPRLPYSTRALPWMIGTTAAMDGIRYSACASSIFNGLTLEIVAPDMPKVVVLPGTIAMMFVPNWVNSPSTKRRAPSPTAVNSTTEAIPTAMPSTVSAERRR